MSASSKLAVSFLLCTTAFVSWAQAQTTGSDGDWEGVWQCADSVNAGAFTVPAIATISGRRIKLSRATDNSDVLNGTIDANGAVVLTGRGSDANGQPTLTSFTGSLSGRTLTATGRAVPLSGGAVQACNLALGPSGGAGTVQRGGRETVPSDYYPPATAVYGGPIWNDDDYYWRRHRWDRWRRTHQARDGGGERPTLCPPGQMPSGGRCRVLPPTPPVTTPPTPPPVKPYPRIEARPADLPPSTPPTAAPPPPTYYDKNPARGYSPSPPAPRSADPPPAAAPSSPSYRDKYTPPPVSSGPSPPPAPSYSPPPSSPAPSYSKPSYSSPPPAAAPAPPPPPPSSGSSGCSGAECYKKR